MAEVKSRKTGKVVAAVAAILAILFFAASFAFDRMQLASTYERAAEADVSLQPTYEAFSEGHPRTPVEFQMGGATLRGYVYEAESPKGFVIFRHGVNSTHLSYLALITALVDRGWTVMGYDALGCGGSDGDSIIGLPQSALDVAVAVDHVREAGLADGLPLVLWGHSWGGYGVAAALDIVPDVDACVTMSGFDSPIGVIYEWTDRIIGPAGVTQRPTLWLANKLDFGADADRTALDGINKAAVPVLVIHATGDAVVSHDGSGIIAQRDHIANANVKYLEPSEPGRDGHNTYFYTEESAAYLADKAEELSALEGLYPDGIPDSAAREFLASYDVLRANRADPTLMDAIDSFLAASVEGADG